MARKNNPIRSLLSNKVYVLCLFLIIVGFFIYWFHFHKNVSTLPNTNKLSAATAAKTPTTAAQQTPPESPKTPTGNQTGVAASSSSSSLIAPYGSFVSNHHPRANDQEESLCSSTPGASCYIELVNGSNVKKLDPETIGSDGSVAWTWNTNSLSPGTWTVKAVATLNDQNKTTEDQIPLEVQQ